MIVMCILFNYRNYLKWQRNALKLKDWIVNLITLISKTRHTPQRKIMQKENVCIYFLLQRVWEVLRWKMALGNLGQDPAKTITMAKQSTDNTDLPFICNKKRKKIYMNIHIHEHVRTNPPYRYTSILLQILWTDNIIKYKTPHLTPYHTIIEQSIEWHDKIFKIIANDTVPTVANHAA